MVDHKEIIVYSVKEIEFLEAKIERLENENRHLKSALKKQVSFGNKMTEMIAEMDELLEKKKLKIESLTSQLQIPPIDAKDEVFDDFCLDLEVPEQKNGFLELQKERKMMKQKSQFEKNQNGKFKCPYEDICDFVSAYPGNMRVHMRIHTNEKPYACDFCDKQFRSRSACKNHVMTHPEMNGVNCKHCHRKISRENIENHEEKCSIRPSRKRRRTKTTMKQEYEALPPY